jgi:uncharacterized surface protein with fasciclin (FAS1) repeats
MKISRSLVLVALFAATPVFSAAHAQEHPTKNRQSHEAVAPTKAEPAAEANSILAVAAGTDDLKTFVAAVKAAGLTEKLQGKGPFTVFAPSDAAFAKLPDGTVDDLLQPANRARLAGILACHVVPGKIMAADIKTMKATNVAGQDLDIEAHDGTVTVDGAKVVRSDLVASNGVIHVVDTVIMPKTDAKPASDKPKDHPAH